MRPRPTPSVLLGVATSPADVALAIRTLPRGSPAPLPGTALTDAQITDWASAYVQAQQDPGLVADDSHPQWWAVEKAVLFSAAGRFEDCWRLVLEVLRLTCDPEVLGVLAAGVLEDIIEEAGPAFVRRIEWQAWTDPAFRRLLAAAWPCGSPDVWARIEAARSLHAEGPDGPD